MMIKKNKQIYEKLGKKNQIKKNSKNSYKITSLYKWGYTGKMIKNLIQTLGKHERKF